MASTHAVLSDSTDQYATITDGAQTGLDLSGDCTLSAWIRPDAIGRFHTICGKWNGGANQRSYIFRVENTNYLRFFYSDNGTDTYYAQSAATVTGWAINTWFHLAMRYNSTAKTVQFFIDGTLFGSPVAVTGGTGTIFNSTSDFRVGNYADGTAATSIEGRLDQVRVYDDQRTNAEVWADSVSDPAAGANLVAGYKLDNDFVDVSGNGNTLTNNGLTFSTAELPPTEANDLSLLSGDDFIAGAVSPGGVGEYDGSAVNPASGVSAPATQGQISFLERPFLR